MQLGRLCKEIAASKEDPTQAYIFVYSIFILCYTVVCYNRRINVNRTKHNEKIGWHQNSMLKLNEAYCYGFGKK